jgi:prepilin-type N-terminal cleavage/methylation domain-containing protein
MKKGFTLVELIVVVAVVGVLAVALMMTINPVEQVNKARDTKKVNQAKEIIDAAQRYYQIVDSDPTCQDLIDEGEITSCDPSFTFGGSGGSYTIEFSPDSRAYQDACGSSCIVPDDIGGIGGS